MSVYTVEPNDTLSEIAERFGITLSELLVANPQVQDPDRISVGQQLTVPDGNGSTVPPAGGDLRTRVLGEAAKRQGIPYRISPPPDGVSNLDCSLFVLVAFRGAGIPFPPGVRTAEQIRQACDPIDWSAVQPGDLLFFEHTYEPGEPPGPDGHIASHVGISLGAGTQRMWDAHCSSGDSGLPGVGQTDVGSSYWQEHLLEARRPRQLVAADTPAGSAAPPAAPRYRVTDDAVHLRQAPGLAGPILAELAEGTVVVAQDASVVAADGYEWRQMRALDGRTGWIATAFLAPLEVGQDGPPLSDAADHAFTLAQLEPCIQSAAARYGADRQVIAAIIAQESGFTNWRVHRDGTGHGLIGLDDNGLLPDFERWACFSCGRGAAAACIPPMLQIDYLAKTIAALTRTYGSAYAAARVWHRGPSLWQDTQGDLYESLIRGHVQRLFA